MSRLGDCLVGDLLRARSRTSGCDLAKLALVGDWKDARLGERNSRLSAGGCDAPMEKSTASPVLRRFGGEFIAEIYTCSMFNHADCARSPVERAHKQRCLQCLHL